MKKIMPNSVENCKRYFLVFASIVLVLISSCSVKANIRNFIGIPLKMEQSFPKGNHNSSFLSLEKCANIDISNIQIVQDFSFDVNAILPVILFTASFLLFIGFGATIKENSHPLYSGSGKIYNTVPLFLEYKKLILHFSH